MKKQFNYFLKRIINIVFSRVTILGLLVLSQFVVLMAMFNWLSNYTVYMYAALILTAFVTVIYIVNSENDSLVKIGWIIPILIAPVFGVLFYIFVTYQPTTAILKKRFQTIDASIDFYMKQDNFVVDELSEKSPHTANLANYLYNLGGYPVYKDTTIQYFSLGEHKFEKMIEELKKAEKFIFIEYFIIEEGHMWNSILSILEEKVEEGVEVRVMYDGTCSVLHLPFRYLNKFKNSKIQFKIFSPIRPLLSTIQNNRDHRKIMVIDGVTAFTGGINISDEYINHKQVFGHWKDTAIMLKGTAVKSFTAMFLQTWNMTSAKIDDFSKYINDTPFQSDGFVIPYGDNPFNDDHFGINLYNTIISNAKKYVHIYTPYLVPNDNLINSMIFAAKRGVDVSLILPGIQDKQYCRALAYRYYPQLIKSGVKIFHYSPGFIHAKSIVSDDSYAMVGTQNLDFRSLFLHFECGAFMYDNSCIHDIEKDFQETLKECNQIDLDYISRLKVSTRVFGSLLRIIAPLL